MEKEKVDRIKLRKEMAIHAKHNGISETARRYNTTRKTVRKWLKRYAGNEQMENLSRRGQKCPHKMPEDLESKILELRKENPEWGAVKIKKHLNIPFSTTTIYNKFLRNNLIEIRKKNENAEQSFETYASDIKPFEKIFVFTRKITGLINKREIKVMNLPEIQIIAYDCKTSMFFIGFAREKTILDSAIFIDYLLNTLSRDKLLTENTQIITSKTIEFSTKYNQNLFTEIISKKFFCEHIFNTDLKDEYDYIIKKVMKNINNCIYDTSGEQLTIEQVVLKNMLTNLDEIASYDMFERLKNAVLIVPIITDMFIPKISDIRYRNIWPKDYFRSNSKLMHNIILKIDSEISEAKAEYQFEKLLTLFDIKLLIYGSGSSEYIRVFKEKFRIMINRGLTKRSEEILKELLIHINHEVDNVEISESYMTIGDYYFMNYQLKKAEGFYSIAENILNNNPDERILCMLYSKIGKVNLEQGHILNAIKKFFNQMSLSKNLKDDLLIAEANDNLALAYFHKDESQKALDHLLDNVPIYEQHNEIEKLFAVYGNLGKIYTSQMKSNEARKVFEKALRFAHRLDNRLRIAEIYSSLGTLYYVENHYEYALDNLAKSYSYYKKITNVKGMAEIEYKKSKVYLEMNCSLNSFLSLENAIKIYSEIENDYLVAICYLQIVEVLFRIKQYKNCGEFLAKAEKLSRENNYIDILKAVRLKDFELHYYESESFERKYDIILDFSNKIYDSHGDIQERSYNVYSLWELTKDLYVNNHFDNSEIKSLFIKTNKEAYELFKNLYRANPIYQVKRKLNKLSNYII
ncbi:MAG: tetratricopeptide repeat protein [Candidatus Delongbacteria bacterium]|nr:tetratricopeptide repeat protein [Candidatus Delongbacteria bacterium]MBN2835850.1 tetratricopeptide repeat protein [Candidatus Delongbacteria bacterium]